MQAMTIRCGAVLAALVVLVACRESPPPEAAPQPWVIDAPRSVGGITPDSTRDELEALFGEENVSPWQIDVGEGMTVTGTRVHGGSPNAVLVEWHPDGTPLRLSISGEGSDWRTAEGIGIGSTLAEVEAANGAPFLLTGFGWDYGGRTVSWEGGALPQELQLEFAGSVRLPPEDMSAISGDGRFSSTHPAMRRYELTVRRIFVRWVESVSPEDKD